jgi:UDP-N-acetylmuramate dehydrogenase
MNPTVDAAVAAGIERRLAASGSLKPGETMPAFPGPKGVKLSAAWLIERAGFPKGTAQGAVGISTKHALAIVNRGGATAAEIVAFARRIHQGVHDRFGIALRAEPAFVGFAQGELEGFADAPS